MKKINNKFLPYGKQNVNNEDIEAVLKVLKSDFLTQGPKVPEFENLICKKVSVKHGIAVNSATSALHIACLALGLKKGDILWTSPITFVASANCARYCNANVDFVDINLNTGLIDINLLKNKLQYAEKKNCLPKILVPVHLSGSSCDMKKIKELSQEYGFHIIEDASHAIGGRYENSYVGNCRYSDITVFSFHPVKIITTGEGGMAMTNDDEIASRLRELRTHGITKDPKKFINRNLGQWFYEQHTLGFNYRMNDIQAALGISQFKRIDKIVRERQNQFDFYRSLVKDTQIKFLEIPLNVFSSVHLAVAIIPEEYIHKYREIFDFMKLNNVGVQLHYLPVHLQPYYEKLGFKKGDFPNAEKYSSIALSLPVYIGLTRSDQKLIIDLLKEILSSLKEC